MLSLQKIKRKNLDLDKYSKAVQQALNYRIYAEYWYLDILTDEKWECWVWGDYEAVMPVPLQYKFLFKFVLQPTYCQQLGVFYKKEIPDNLFREFEKKLHQYRVRSYCFNEENTERYNPAGEKKVNYILDLSLPYEELYRNYRKDKKKNINKSNNGVYIKETPDFESYCEILEKHYPNLSRPNTRLLNKLSEKKLLLQYTATIDERVNNHRIFMLSDNRIFVLASVRNKTTKIDLSSIIIDFIIHKYSSSVDLLLDFEGSMIKGVAEFNEGFGAVKKKYCCFSNFNFKRT